MSNKIAFLNVVRRAQNKADNCMSLLENTSITTNVSVILFASKHIQKLEEQNLALQNELVELRAIASQVKIHDQLLGGVLLPE